MDDMEYLMHPSPPEPPSNSRFVYSHPQPPHLHHHHQQQQPPPLPPHHHSHHSHHHPQQHPLHPTGCPFVRNLPSHLPHPNPNPPPPPPSGLGSSPPSRGHYDPVHAPASTHQWFQQQAPPPPPPSAPSQYWAPMASMPVTFPPRLEPLDAHYSAIHGPGGPSGLGVPPPLSHQLPPHLDPFTSAWSTRRQQQAAQQAQQQAAALQQRVPPPAAPDRFGGAAPASQQQQQQAQQTSNSASSGGLNSNNNGSLERSTPGATSSSVSSSSSAPTSSAITTPHRLFPSPQNPHRPSAPANNMTSISDDASPSSAGRSPFTPSDPASRVSQRPAPPPQQPTTSTNTTSSSSSATSPLESSLSMPIALSRQISQAGSSGPRHGEPISSPGGSGATMAPPIPIPIERRRTTTIPPPRRRPSASRPVSHSESDDEMDTIEDEQQQAMRFLEHFHSGAAPYPVRLGDMSEDRVRAHQLLRGAMSNRRVASKAALASLQSVEISSLPENERMCIICYNDFGTPTPEGINEAPLRLPKCKHVFGDHCIKKWFEESDSCPYCRDKVHSEPQFRATSQAVQQFIQAQRMAAVRRSAPGAAGTSGGSGSPNFHVYPGHDVYLRVMGREPVVDLSTGGPHRGWGSERRSPPDELGEHRRRTRPRHGSFHRGSPPSSIANGSNNAGGGGSNPRPNSFAGSSSSGADHGPPPPPQMPSLVRERLAPHHPRGGPSWHSPAHHFGTRRLTALSRQYQPIGNMGQQQGGQYPAPRPPLMSIPPYPLPGIPSLGGPDGTPHPPAPVSMALPGVSAPSWVSVSPSDGPLANPMTSLGPGPSVETGAPFPGPGMAFGHALPPVGPVDGPFGALAGPSTSSPVASSEAWPQ